MGTVDSQHEQWARVLSAARGTGAGDTVVLGTAMELGLRIAPDVVGCSVTEVFDAGGRTPVWANDVALQLDLAQYEDNAGPCLSAAR